MRTMKRALCHLMVWSGLGLAAVASADDTLSKIKAEKKAVMGVRESSSPLSFTLGGGKFVGYHVELCERILKAIAPDAKIEYTPVTSANRIPLTQNGTVDIECGSTTNNAARQKDVSFAHTTFVTEVRTAVRANSGITSINQLNGKKVATTTGTTSVALLRKHERATGINFEELYGKDHADSFLMLESGRADAFVMDDNLLAGFIANAKDPKAFAIVGEVLNVEPIAIMMRKDEAFQKAVNAELDKLIKNGEVAKAYQKWFMSPIPPKNTAVNLPMGATLKAALASPNDKPAEDYNKK